MLQEIGRKSEEIGGNREIGEIGENQQCCTVNTQGWFYGGEWIVENAQGSPAVVLEWTVENAQDASRRLSRPRNSRGVPNETKLADLLCAPRDET